MKFSNIVYKFRGGILGAFALLLLILPPGELPVSASGILLLFLAACVRITARRNIGMHSRGNRLEAPRLVREGIYSKVRHPLYLSNGLMGSGFVLLHLNWQSATFIFLGALWIFVGFLAQNEDAFLRQEFGDEWVRFADEVPAFIPRLKGQMNRNYMQSVFAAFASDLWTWIFLIVLTGLVVARRYLF